MNEMQVFKYNSADVRTVIKDGEPWWVLKDVCEVFGDTNYRRSAATIDGDEKGVSQIDTPGGKQEMSIINEQGLYSLLFAMQPTKARGVTDEYIENREKELKAFRRWVTHEVLPSIRKHGAYMTPQTIDELILNPDSIIKLAMALKEEQGKSRLLEQTIKEQAPQVVFANAVSVSKTSILVGEMAKLLNQNGIDIGQNRFFQWLRDNGYLVKRQGTDYNMPTQLSMGLELFVIKETSISHSDGHVSINKTPKVTGKGQIYFINKFKTSYGISKQ